MELPSPVTGVVKTRRFKSILKVHTPGATDGSSSAKALRVSEGVGRELEQVLQARLDRMLACIIICTRRSPADEEADSLQGHGPSPPPQPGATRHAAPNMNPRTSAPPQSSAEMLFFSSVGSAAAAGGSALRGSSVQRPWFYTRHAAHPRGLPTTAQAHESKHELSGARSPHLGASVGI